MFFAVFGGAWITLAHYAAGRLSVHTGVLIATAAAVLIFVALRLQSRGKHVGRDAFPTDEQQRNDRTFAWVNAVTWIAVFLIFTSFPRLGYSSLSIPAAAIVVGLHFFPMPPLYRHRANLVTGGAIVVWTALSSVIWRGDLRIAVVAAGVGLILWLSAAWALKTAGALLKSAGL